MRSILVTPVLASLLLLGACSGGDQDAATAPTSTAQPDAPQSEPSEPSEPSPTTPDLTQDPTEGTEPNADSDACDEVVEGIADFNQGDYEGTVSHFEDAVPLARAELRAAEEGDREQARLLLEAVRYYADLAPDDYPEAARSSVDFARYKAITLGQCVADGQAPGVPDDGGGVDV